MSKLNGIGKLSCFLLIGKRSGFSLIELLVGLFGATILALILCQLVLFVTLRVVLYQNEQGTLDALLAIDSIKRDLMCSVPHYSFEKKQIICKHTLDKKGFPIETFVHWNCVPHGISRKEGMYDLTNHTFYPRTTSFIRCPITSLFFESIIENTPNVCRYKYFTIFYKTGEKDYKTRISSCNTLTKS